MATRQVLTYVAVAATAAAAGVFVGMLVAPASGEETRQRLRRHLAEKEDDLRKTARHTVDRAAAFAAERIEAGKEKLGALLEH